jgi:sigma-B regulation protein RsbU (phosphoserine phosphatase)
MPNQAERILIIDQDTECRRFLSHYLVSKGYYVETAPSLYAAQPIIVKHTPDLIFADLDVDEIMRLCNHHFSHESSSPLVALKHASTAEEVVECLRAGASDFIIKPVNDIKQLDDVILRIFDRVRLFRLNEKYRLELEETNKSLKAGISELKADQNAGLKVQMKMLPDHEKTIDNIFFDHLIQPSLYLSGDFLDYFKLDDNRVLFYLADVSGHGASSAFATVLLKNLTNRLVRNLNRHSSDDISYPDKYLHRVNKELLETQLGKHLTMFVGIIENDTRKLTYSVAAHFPMPILATEEETVYLTGQGMPIGLFEEPQFQVYEQVLPEKFRLFLFSDGILEVIEAKKSIRKRELVT